MNRCEHCGPTKHKVYLDPSGDTHWCLACVRCLEYMCGKHPYYRVLRKPRCACEKCWFLWFDKQGREHFGW